MSAQMFDERTATGPVPLWATLVTLFLLTVQTVALLVLLARLDTTLSTARCLNAPRTMQVCQ